MKPCVCGWALIFALSVATGCSSGDSATSWQRSYDTSGMLIGADASYDLGYHSRWATNLNLSNGKQLAAAKILDDILVTVAAPGNLVSAISMRSGKPMWTVIVGTETENLFAPIRYKNAIYVNSETHLYELDAHTGEILSNAPLTETVIGGPILIDDRAIFGSVNGTVFAHSLVSGRYRWKYRLTSRIITPPIAVGLNIFAVDAKGVYVMLFAQDGTPMWKGRTFDAVTVPAASDRVSVYVASRDTALYALKRSTGDDKWKYSAAQPLTLPAKAIGLSVYLPIAGEKLLALDSVDGGVRWELDEPAWPVTIRGDNLLVATSGSLQLIEVDAGRVVQRVPTADLATVLIGPDDSVVLVTAKGRLMRLDPI